MPTCICLNSFLLILHPEFAKKFDIRAPYSWISKVEYLFYDVFAHDALLSFWSNPDIFRKKRQP